MSHSTTQLPASAIRLLRIARLLTWAGLLLFVGAMVWGCYEMVSDSKTFDLVLSENFLGEERLFAFSTGQRLVGAVLLIFAIGSGIVGLWLVLQLFAGYLKGQVFSLAAVQRLRLIGWMVVALFPMGLISEALGSYLFSGWAQAVNTKVEISISDGDVFALVFGLLIVVVGHVMYQALSISEENQSFV